MPAPPLPPNPINHPPPTPAAETPVQQPAPLIETVMYNLLGANWKTSVQGFLGFLATGTGTLTAWLSGYIATHPGTKSAWWAAFASSAVAVASGIAKWYIGTKQTDAQPQ